jgi:hypothetical protein
MKLNSWFEISEKEYIWYKLQGYKIDANSDRVVWELDDKLHREDGPAVIWAHGAQRWYLNGNLHRTDGPAYIRADGTQRWFLNDRAYTEQEWQNAVSELV